MQPIFEVFTSKIGIFLLSSKLFVTFFCFVQRNTNKICNFVAAICLLRLGFTLRCEEPARWSTTYWKSDTVRFVFGGLNVGNSYPYQKQCRGDAYGCVYTQPECAEG